MHPNRLFNGDISRDLTQWTAAGAAVYLASQGNKELGSASLPSAGSSIEQSFSIGIGRPYMIDVSVKGTGVGNVTVSIINSEAVTVWSSNLTVTASWVTHSTRVGLAWGEYTFKVAYSDVACYVDDLSVAFVPKTRAELAAIVSARLGALATNASMSTSSSGDNTEGDYTQAVNEGLRAVEAVDPAGREDVRYLLAEVVDSCLGQIEFSMLKKLQRYWATRTDYTIGPRTENINQINNALLALTGSAVGGRPANAGRSVKQRKLIHQNPL